MINRDIDKVTWSFNMVVNRIVALTAGYFKNVVIRLTYNNHQVIKRTHQQHSSLDFLISYQNRYKLALFDNTKY